MVNKHTVDYHPSPSQLISRIHTHISMDSLGVYLSRIFLEFFPKPVYSTMVKSFKFIVLRLLEIYLWVKKLFISTHAPKQNSPPGLYHYPPGRRELPIPPKQRFVKIFFPEGKDGDDYGLEKNTKMNKGISHK